MKYIIDIDALKNCMDFMESHGKINGDPLVYLSQVKDFIDAFPKTPTDYMIPPLMIKDDYECGTMQMIMERGKRQDPGDA